MFHDNFSIVKILNHAFHLWLSNVRSNEKCINCFGSITKHRLQNQPNTNMVQLTSSHKKLTELFLKLFEEKMFLFYTLNAIRKFSLKRVIHLQELKTKLYQAAKPGKYQYSSIFWFWVFLMVVFHDMQTGVTMLKYHSVTV